MKTTELTEIFGEPISIYTRAQGIEDGVLVDVTETAREAGFKWPVALTSALFAVIEHQGDFAGRLWDVLWMATLAARRPLRPSEHDREYKLYQLILPYHRQKMTTVKMVSGPGDHGEPVITLMLPNED